MLSIQNELSASVDQRQGELLDILKELVRYPTVSPPARNTREVQQYIESFLQRVHFETDSWDVYENDPNVVGIKKGTEGERYNSLIINGHIDVAEVGDQSEWTVPVFDMITKNGFAYGRGVADMKGAMAAALFAFKLLNEHGIELKGDLQFQSVIGEEVGEAGTLSCIERGYSGDFALVMDVSDSEIQGQGGVITGWITVKSREVFHDAMRLHMIHAGGGVYGASAIEKMMKIIAGLQELERHWAITKHYPGFPAGANTINPAVIEGGRHPAFIADECRLWVTVHYYPNETYESVTAEIENHIRRVAEADPWLKDNPPQFRWGGRSMIEEKGEIFPALELKESHPAIKRLQQSHQQVWQTAAKTGMSKTVTDGGWFQEAGIPAAIYGPGTVEEAHSVDEKINIEQLCKFTKTLLHFMVEWCNTKKE